MDRDRGAGPPRLGPHAPPAPAVSPLSAAIPPVAPQAVQTRNICIEGWVGLKKGHLYLQKRRKVKDQFILFSLDFSMKNFD